MSEKQHVAMIHESCPICGCDMNDQIMLATRYRDTSKGMEPVHDLAPYHNKSTGYANKPCEECQKIFDLGAIALIIADMDKSGKEPIELYRCGHVFGVTEDYTKRLTQDNLEFQKEVLEKRVMVMDYRIAKSLGFEINYPRK